MTPSIEFEYEGEIIHWRGPSPFHFVPVPQDESDIIKEVASVVSYGWGVIPVVARIGGTEYSTSLFPKDHGYLLPVKDAVRKGEALEIGDQITVRMTIDMSKA
jgi:hypothetical protein